MILSLATNALKKTRKRLRKNLKPAIRLAQYWKLLPSKRGVRHDALPGLFRDLDQENCRYVVLRWFEKLPTVTDDDLDILVSNEDHEKLLAHTTKGYRGDDVVKMDISTVTKDQKAKSAISYYPPHLAREIIEKSILHPSGARVPDDIHYFLSLTYHALYHKGFSSGLPSKHRSEPPKPSEHDYEATLRSLASRVGFTPEMTMEGLETFLSERDWTPPLDLYYRMSRSNTWARRRAEHHTKEEWRSNYGLSVILLREKAARPDIAGGIVEHLESELKKHDCAVEEKHELTKTQSRFVAKRTRGGDWNIGPFAINGGDPIIAYIVRKNNTGNDLRRESIPHGSIEYPWIKDIKRSMRRYCHDLDPEGSFNPLHTSDNGVDAAYYSEILHTSQTINK
ncbi:MAG: hypothetical protein WDZ79_01320 [Candidatus Paceibacterota bacterium]